MQRVSSNLSIIIKIFFPTFWIVFFGSFTLSLFLVDETTLPFLTSPIFKYPFLTAFLLFFMLIYFTLMQILRVEMGTEYYVATNYFKTLKLIYEDIETIEIIKLGRFQIITFKLKAKSYFGKKITFLASTFLLNNFLDNNPKTKEVIDRKTKT